MSGLPEDATEAPISRSEMVLIRRAMREDCLVSAEQRHRTVVRIGLLIDDPLASARDRRKALETLQTIETAGWLS